MPKCTLLLHVPQSFHDTCSEEEEEQEEEEQEEEQEQEQDCWEM